MEKPTLKDRVIALAAQDMSAKDIAAETGTTIATVHAYKTKYAGLILGEKRRLAGRAPDGTPLSKPATTNKIAGSEFHAEKLAAEATIPITLSDEVRDAIKAAIASDPEKPSFVETDRPKSTIELVERKWRGRFANYYEGPVGYSGIYDFAAGISNGSLTDLLPEVIAELQEMLAIVERSDAQC